MFAGLLLLFVVVLLLVLLLILLLLLLLPLLLLLLGWLAWALYRHTSQTSSRARRRAANTFYLVL